MLPYSGARGGTVGWGTALQTGRSRVRFTGIFHWHNPSGRTMALGLTQPGVARRVGRGIALLFLDRGTRRGWVVSSTPRPHFTLGKDPVPILQEAQGPVWTGGKSRPYQDSIPDHPAHSQSLYRLSYPAHNRNEYQEYFLGVKAAGAWGWQPYHLHVPIVLKSGSLNLLEPSGPVQACNGIALPFTVIQGNQLFICVIRDLVGSNNNSAGNLYSDTSANEDNSFRNHSLAETWFPAGFYRKPFNSFWMLPTI